MPVFHVTMRAVQPPGPPRKRPSRARQRLFAVLRYFQGMSVVGGLFALTIVLLHSQVLFILLPVGLSVVLTAVTQRTELRNVRALILKTFVALVYFGAITGWELLTHGPGTPEIVVVTTTLAIAVILVPLRTYLQAFLEQRFHLSDDATTKAVEAFTSTLREEIDLHQVCERFLAVVQQILHPQAVSLWVRAPTHDTPESLPAPAAGALDDRRLPGGAPADEQPSLPQFLAAESPVMGLDLAPSTGNVDVSIADADPLIAYALSHPGAVELDRLQLDSPAVRNLKASATELVLPLASQGELLGLLTLGPRLGVERRTSEPFIGRFMPLLSLSLLDLFRSGPRVYELEYTREDRALLNTLAAQVAPALSVAQLVRAQQAQVRERERIEQELRTAQAIQRTFLPKDTPALPGWRLIPYYQPAHEVGGDFYDFLMFEDGRVGLVIGDVTDKGIPAALVMTATRTMIRTAAQERASPGEVFARVNDLLYADIPTGMFVTCFYAVLDPTSGHLRFANAGHEPPYRRHNGSATELWATGMPLGMMPGTRYQEYEATLAPGEMLLFYSDGLVEAHSASDEMFGFPRLRTVLEGHADGASHDGDAPASLIETVLSELRGFTGEGWEQEDDVTLVMLQRAPQAVAAHSLRTTPSRQA